MSRPCRNVEDIVSEGRRIIEAEKAKHYRFGRSFQISELGHQIQVIRRKRNNPNKEINNESQRSIENRIPPRGERRGGSPFKQTTGNIVIVPGCLEMTELQMINTKK